MLNRQTNPTHNRAIIRMPRGGKNGKEREGEMGKARGRKT